MAAAIAPKHRVWDINGITQAVLELEEKVAALEARLAEVEKKK